VPLLANEATVGCRGLVVLASSSGERLVAADDFFDYPLVTALHPDELIMEVRLPLLGTGHRGRRSRRLREIVSSNLPLHRLSADLGRRPGGGRAPHQSDLTHLM